MALDLRYSQTNLTQPVGAPTQIVGFVPCDNNTPVAGGVAVIDQLVGQSDGTGGNTGLLNLATPGSGAILTDPRLGGPNPNVVPTTAQAGTDNGLPAGDAASSTAQGGGLGATSTGLFTAQGAMSRGQIGGGQVDTTLAAN